MDLNAMGPRPRIPHPQADGKVYLMAIPAFLLLKTFNTKGTPMAGNTLPPTYQYALVAGPDKSFLWLLSRTPTMNPDKQRELIAEAQGLGFDTTKLVFVDQDG